MRERNLKMDLQELGLEEKLTEDAFLNSLQAGVNHWTKEILRVTRLTR